MSAEPRLSFTLEEYFALERASERRFEFRDGEVVCMSGGTIEHATIGDNVRSALRASLADKGCRTFSSDLAIFVPEGRPYRYPDVSVACGELLYRTVDGRDVLENPVLIVEVLSKTTADYDRGTKFEEHKSIPTFRGYLLVDQGKPHVAYREELADGGWAEHSFESLDDVISIGCLGADLALGDVYEAVAFKSEKPDPT